MEHINEFMRNLKDIADKYGFWQVVLALILLVLAWRFPDILDILRQW